VRLVYLVRWAYRRLLHLDSRFDSQTQAQPQAEQEQEDHDAGHVPLHLAGLCQVSHVAVVVDILLHPSAGDGVMLDA